MAKPAQPKPPKLKKCPICKSDYIPWSSTQKVCSDWQCGLVFSRQHEAERQAREIRKQERLQRAELRVRRERLKGKPEWNREAQAAVNRYIFWRDYGRPCISCGRQLNYGVRGGAVDASHYRSRGAAPWLRFNVFNNNASCVPCNRDLSGNPIPYRINLIEKFGLHRVERIEHDNTVRKFDIEYMKRVKAVFTRRARHYEKLRKRQQEAAA